MLTYLSKPHEGTLMKLFPVHVIQYLVPPINREYGPRNDQSLVRIQINIHDQVRNSQSLGVHCTEEHIPMFPPLKRIFL